MSPYLQLAAFGVLRFLPTLGGDERNRTADPLLARQVLSQLSYTPILNRIYSRICSSNGFYAVCCSFPLKTSVPEKKMSYFALPLCFLHPRKEVIQPHLPIRLPCYDFTPVIDLTFDSSLLAVKPLASGAPNFRGVTGGVYKARERIHRDMLIRDY